MQICIFDFKQKKLLPVVTKKSIENGHDGEQVEQYLQNVVEKTVCQGSYKDV